MSLITISLGWGVQSFTLAAMSALGRLPKVDMAIHADTDHERQKTYEFAARWTPWLESHGIRVVTVTRKSHKRDLEDIPAFTSSSDKGGQLRRQCTGHWKIEPMRQWLQSVRSGRNVDMMIGISLDEIERTRPSNVKYITHLYPLLDLRMTRAHCVGWLESEGLGVPPKSSCTFCPFHSRHAWDDMKRESGQDWNEAIKIDNAIRKLRPPFDLFVHRDRVPLTNLKISDDLGYFQADMFSEECSGACFV